MQGWYVITGKLPEGLKLNKKTGEITGTPEEFGEFVFEVRLENACGIADKWITINICGEPTITGDDTFNFIMGKPDSYQLTFEGTPPNVVPDEGIKGSFEFSDLIELGQTVNISSPVQLTKGNIFKTKITGNITRLVDEHTTVIHNIEDSGVIDANTMFAVGEEIDSISPTLHFGIDENFKITSVTSLNADIQGIDIVFDSETTEEEPDFESIIHIIDSSDGEFIVPTRGYGSTEQDVPYNWIIEGSLDGKNYTFIQNASGTGSYDGDINLTIPVELRSTNMYLRIRHLNTEPDYAWARAFGFGDYNYGSGLPTNRAKVKSADISGCQKGLRLDGTNSLGDYFLYQVWRDCLSLQTTIVPDTSNWGITSIGNDFLGGTWTRCTSLQTAVVPDTSNWNVTSIGNWFLGGTWSGCTSLQTAVVPNTSNWNVNSIGNSFLGGTWSECTSLQTAVVPDTSNWNVNSVGNALLNSTWSACAALQTAVVPDTSNWNVNSVGNSFLLSTWQRCTVLQTAVVPDTSNWNVNSIGNDFLGYTWQGCTALQTAASPNTSNWNVNSIEGGFLVYTWQSCSALQTAAAPNTSNWQVSGTVNSFLSSTWSYCTSLVNAVVPDTSNWNVTGIENSFLSYTWTGCSSLQTAAVPDTSNWNVSGSIGSHFLNYTWGDCSSLQTAAVPDTSNWNISGSIGNNFLNQTWTGCSSLQTAAVPDTSNWNVSGSIGNNFLSITWGGCTPLQTAVVPDTSNWNISGSIGNWFLGSTWNGCTSLQTAVVPNTSNWNVSGSIGNNFLRSTWSGCYLSLKIVVLPDTSNWNVTSIDSSFLDYTFSTTSLMIVTIPDNISKPIYTGSIRPLQSNSASISNSSINQIKVPSALISAFQSSSSWSNITSSKFVAI